MLLTSDFVLPDVAGSETHSVVAAIVETVIWQMRVRLKMSAREQRAAAVGGGEQHLNESTTGPDE